MRSLLIGMTLTMVAMTLGVEGRTETTTDAEFIDPRDGMKYRTVLIGSEVWLGQNLSYDMEGSWAYDEDSTNVEIYGRLYGWDAASCACPPGWHLPSAVEWTALFDSIGGAAVAGGSLKEAGTEFWREPNTAATNAIEFGGLPGGGRRQAEGSYHGLGMFGAFWSSTEQGEDRAWGFFLGYHYPEVSLRPSTSKGFGASIRCVKD